MCNEKALDQGIKDRRAAGDHLIQQGNLWELTDTNAEQQAHRFLVRVAQMLLRLLRLGLKEKIYDI